MRNEFQLFIWMSELANTNMPQNVAPSSQIFMADWYHRTGIDYEIPVLSIFWISKWFHLTSLNFISVSCQPNFWYGTVNAEEQQVLQIQDVYF